MQIRPTSNIQTSAVNLQTQNKTQSTTNTNSVPVDQVEISAEAQLMSTQAAGTEIRSDLVADVRAQIAEGQYDTAEKMDIAMSRLFDELA